MYQPCYKLFILSLFFVLLFLSLTLCLPLSLSLYLSLSPTPGADQEHKTDEMHTALMEACMDGHVEVARLLLDHGAQVSICTVHCTCV